MTNEEKKTEENGSVLLSLVRVAAKFNTENTKYNSNAFVFNRDKLYTENNTSIYNNRLAILV